MHTDGRTDLCVHNVRVFFAFPQRVVVFDGARFILYSSYVPPQTTRPPKRAKRGSTQRRVYLPGGKLSSCFHPAAYYTAGRKVELFGRKSNLREIVRSCPWTFVLL